MHKSLLTPYELEALDLAAKLATWCGLIVEGPNREKDLGEIIAHIHAVQQALLSQAGARAYPDKFRLLGRTFEE